MRVLARGRGREHADILAAQFGNGLTINATHVKDKSVDTPNGSIPIPAPSTYTFKLLDNSASHNFRLLLNGKTVKDQAGKDVVTSVDAAPGEVKLRIKLRAKANGKPQTYLLVCDPHRAAGMVVKLRVGAPSTA